MSTMTSADASWGKFEHALRAKLTAAINADPRSLLDTVGGPAGLKAGWTLATLLGFDEEVDAEIVLSGVVPPSLSWAIPQRQRVPPRDAIPDPSGPSFRTADYKLQSSYATLDVSLEALDCLPPPEAKIDRATHTLTVALVRYRRVP